MSYFIINTAVASLYKRPSHEAAIVTQALFGESCKIIVQDGDWLKIEQWDGYTGWIYHFYGIKSDKKYNANYSLQEMHGTIINEKAEIFTNIVFGCQVDASKNSEIFEIHLPDGNIGVSKDQLGLTHQPKTREKIIEIAKQFLGIPYLWGGKSVYGMDCSGLVQTVFKSVGISLPRDASQQEELMRKHRIAEDDLQTGDLLFFTKNEKVSHVAISKGGLNFINARGSVRIESIDDKNALFNRKLRDLFLYGVSIEELLKE